MESGQCGDERKACCDHGGQLAREKDKVGFWNPADRFGDFPGAALLDTEDEESLGHEEVNGIVLVEGILDSGNGFAGRVAGLIGERVHERFEAGLKFEGAGKLPVALVNDVEGVGGRTFSEKACKSDRGW